jgi:hypothetical protein
MERSIIFTSYQILLQDDEMVVHVDRILDEERLLLDLNERDRMEDEKTILK